ncbi:hypothetical protein, partial [Paenarthrobacter aurescens]|uniref:hypothetical protein n=1 Tax=Paenarthrobacter aurescens TaxID=43663 RepID=UPI0021BE09BE
EVTAQVPLWLDGGRPEFEYVSGRASFGVALKIVDRVPGLVDCQGGCHSGWRVAQHHDWPG